MESLKTKPSYGIGDLQTVLLNEEQISQRISALATEISANYQGTDITLVCVLSGALVFTSDLIRKLEVPNRLDCIRADSYGDSSRASGLPRVSNPLKTDIQSRHVLVIDDILDTGNTLSAIREHLSEANPASLKSCVLLDKKERRQLDIEADFAGFEIPDAFVVGYGLDFAERYRNLPCIGVLKEEFQSAQHH